MANNLSERAIAMERDAGPKPTQRRSSGVESSGPGERALAMARELVAWVKDDGDWWDEPSLMALNGGEISLLVTSTEAALGGSEVNCLRCWMAAASVVELVMIMPSEELY